MRNRAIAAQTSGSAVKLKVHIKLERGHGYGWAWAMGSPRISLTRAALSQKQTSRRQYATIIWHSLCLLGVAYPTMPCGDETKEPGGGNLGCIGVCGSCPSRPPSRGVDQPKPAELYKSKGDGEYASGRQPTGQTWSLFNQGSSCVTASIDSIGDVVGGSSCHPLIHQRS